MVWQDGFSAVKGELRDVQRWERENGQWAMFVPSPLAGSIFSFLFFFSVWMSFFLHFWSLVIFWGVRILSPNDRR